MTARLTASFPAPAVSGTEARVCADIARRQLLGLAKYGTSVEANPLELRAWLQHAYEELLDAAIYLRRSIEEIDRRATPLPSSTHHEDPMTIQFHQLPALGQPLEGGLFVGITTLPDGQHRAVVLLADKPATRLAWQAAMDWAAGLQAELPSRPVSALLFANARDQFERAWHWNNETHEDDGSYAWIQDFYGGTQYSSRKSFEGCARAVRLIHLVP